MVGEKNTASLCVLTAIKNTGILVLFQCSKEVAVDIPSGALSKAWKSKHAHREMEAMQKIIGVLWAECEEAKGEGVCCFSECLEKGRKSI